jgi:hypothetical protein
VQGCQTCGPAKTWARIFQDIDVKQLGNKSLIKITLFSEAEYIEFKILKVSK